MLVESIVFDDVVVSETVSKLRALALSPSRPPDLDLNIRSRDLSSKSTPRSPDSSSTPPSSACESNLACCPCDDALIGSIIHDLVETVCREDITPAWPPVTDGCVLIDFPSLGVNDEDDLGQGDYQRHEQPMSPVLGDSPFQVSSLLDIFYGTESKLADEVVFCPEGEYGCPGKNPKDLCQDVQKLSLNCEVIDVSAECQIPLGWDLAENWDIGYDPFAFDTVTSASKTIPEASSLRNDNEEYIHFLKPKAWTPADLLPLYEPDAPFEMSFATRPSSSAVVSIKDLSDLERLQYDDATEISGVFLKQNLTEMVSHEEEFDNIRDLAKRLSDDDCQNLCGAPLSPDKIDLEPEHPPILSLNINELPLYEIFPEPCRLYSKKPVGNRIRRRSSDFSCSKVKHPRTSFSKDTSETNYLGESYRHEPYRNQNVGEEDTHENRVYAELSLVSYALSFCKSCWSKSMEILFLLWSSCATRFLNCLCSNPPMTFWTNIMSILTYISNALQEILLHKSCRCAFQYPAKRQTS